MADILKKIESCIKRCEIAEAKVRVPRATLEQGIDGQSKPAAASSRRWKVWL